jgi:hypothetical protein
MSLIATAEHGRRARLKRVMAIVDRAGLGLLYAVVIAVVPFATLDLLSRTV